MAAAVVPVQADPVLATVAMETATTTDLTLISLS